MFILVGVPGLAWCTADEINADKIIAAIECLRLEDSENVRYAPDPGNGRTYCNVFVHDLTRLLGCEIPPDSNTTSVAQVQTYLDIEGNGWTQLTVNPESFLIDDTSWLESDSEAEVMEAFEEFVDNIHPDASLGWQAQQLANEGKVVIMLVNDNGSRHVAVVRPDVTGDYPGAWENVGGQSYYFPRVAEAGSSLSENVSSFESFGYYLATEDLPIHYYVFDPEDIDPDFELYAGEWAEYEIPGYQAPGGQIAE